MIKLSRAPTEKNCKRKSTYLYSAEVRKINDGKIDVVCIFDSLENKTYDLNAKECVNALLEQVFHGSSDSYQCFNYGLLVDQMSKQGHSKINPEYWTQDKVALFFNVPANYICDLHKFNFLQPIAKDGRSLLYLKDDVLAAAADPRVQAWQQYCQGGRSIMKGESCLNQINS